MPKVSFSKYSKRTSLRNNFLQDNTVSLKAKALLGIFRSFPEDWTFRKDYIVSNCMCESERIYKKALKELRDRHYIVQKRTRGEGGKWDWHYLIGDEPLSAEEVHKFMVRK